MCESAPTRHTRNTRSCSCSSAACRGPGPGGDVGRPCPPPLLASSSSHPSFGVSVFFLSLRVDFVKFFLCESPKGNQESHWDAARVRSPAFRLPREGRMLEKVIASWSVHSSWSHVGPRWHGNSFREIERRWRTHVAGATSYGSSSPLILHRPNLGGSEGTVPAQHPRPKG